MSVEEGDEKMTRLKKEKTKQTKKAGDGVLLAFGLVLFQVVFQLSRAILVSTFACCTPRSKS